MQKYDLLPGVLLKEGYIAHGDLHQPEEISDELLLKVHSADYLCKLIELRLDRQEERRSGFPQSTALIKREKIIMQGTVDCVDFAFNDGISLNVAGGTHHAFRDRAEGFCLLNDIALAAVYAKEKYKLDKILVVDLDVHQGNGTASIFAQDQQVFTFSMHGKNNYPMHKETSDMDIPLEDGTTDETYLILLRDTLDKILTNFEAQLIIYQCGVDVLASDKLGRMALSIDACLKRDELVFQKAQELNAPVVCAMGGGYSENIDIIVEAHANTFRLASDICSISYFKK